MIFVATEFCHERLFLSQRNFECQKQTFETLKQTNETNNEHVETRNMNIRIRIKNGNQHIKLTIDKMKTGTQIKRISSNSLVETNTARRGIKT